jgi:NitT/TauT family transport system ATP-binding protein
VDFDARQCRPGAPAEADVCDLLLEGERVDAPPPGMAVVFQEYGRSLFPWMRVCENVELPLRRRKSLSRQRRDELVDDAL